MTGTVVGLSGAGQRRETLVADIETMLHAAFAPRILPFDSGAARAYAHSAAPRRRAGRGVAPAACQIAAIARARGLAVATRHMRDFADMAIDLFTPWDGA